MGGARRKPVATALAGALALLLTGCSGVAGASPASSHGRIPVVASTDVWGSVVEAVGDGRVSVTSIIDDPSRDPHDYETDARDRLSVLRAAVVVENGGGYDDFMTGLRQGSSAQVLDAVRLSGADASAADFNEHVWYDLPIVRKVADAVSAALERRDPSNAAGYRSALQRFHGALGALGAEEVAIRHAAEGRGAAITEPVPLYVLAACGLVDRTPRGFSSAIEDGRDVAPAVLRTQLTLLQEHRVALLAVNVQTEEPTTDQVVAAARSAHIPVVAFSETLPTGDSLVDLFHKELAAIRAAVAA